MLLSDDTQGKDNNFKLIRFIAAASVLFGHCFALLKLPEPLANQFGMSIGSIAVDLFFISSGFLVSGSLLTKKNARDYLLARALRIYPALIAVTLITVFVLGPVFTSLPLSRYFSQTETYLFLVKCSTILGGVAFHLPGVFADNPYPDAVNGSLWSMVYEVKMYLLLLIIWLACRKKNNADNHLVKYVIVTLMLIACTLVIFRRLTDLDESRVVRFIFMFFSGTAYWLFQHKVRLRLIYFLSCCAALLIAANISTLAFFVVYQFTVAYILLYLAFVPAGKVRKFNLLGDYSYGVYIVAFPVQQAIIALFPQITLPGLLCATFSITLCFACLSWHLLEQRALTLKKRWSSESVTNRLAMNEPDLKRSST